jgi:hypothetical protein
MKKILFVFFTALSVISTRAQKTIVNDPNAQVRNVKDFHGVEVSNAIDLYLSQSDEESVVVSAKDIKYRDKIQTEVVDGILKIYYERESWKLWQNSNKKLRAYVSIKTINRLKASGASDVYISGSIHVTDIVIGMSGASDLKMTDNGVIEGNKLEMNLSGASDFHGTVKLNELKMDQSGASDADIHGSVTNATNIECSGASDVKGFDLVTDNCTAKATGASDVKITVNKELNAHASGASSIYYKGNAVIRDLHSSGASSVSKKG